MGRRISRSLPAGQSESYSYDAVGNLQSKIDFNGKTTTYVYDSNDRLQSKTPDPSFNAPAVAFTYSATGKRLTMWDVSGVTTYTYDPQTDRLLQKQTPEGTLNYTYDVAGNLKSLQSQNQNGASDAYTYDADNRLSTLPFGKISCSRIANKTAAGVPWLCRVLPTAVNQLLCFQHIERVHPCGLR